MTQNVTDSKLAHYTRWSADVLQRIIKGSLDPNAVMSAVQVLINSPADPFGRFDIQPDGSFKVKVHVNRTQTPMEAFKGITSHKQYLNDTVVAEMLLGTKEEAVLYFFQINKEMTPSELEAEFDRRKLKADPMAQAAWNQTNPDFADRYPNWTQWRNQEGWPISALWKVYDGDRLLAVAPFNCVSEVGWFACGVSNSD